MSFLEAFSLHSGVPAYGGKMGALWTSGFAAVLLALGVGMDSSQGRAAAGDAVRGFVLAAAGMSMDQAVKMVEQRFKARVVRAETQHEGGRMIYVLRVLNDSGQVWLVRVDAASGAIL